MRARASLLPPTLLCAIVCLTGSRIQAFEVLGAKWAAATVPFRINPNFPNVDISGTPEEQISIILCAADAWRSQTRTAVSFDYRGTTTIARLSERDGVNAVFWSSADGGEALAATIFAGDNGVATAFDIIFFGSSDGVANDWSGPGEPASGTFDIQGVAVHELGHALGLAHSPISQATMFASVSGRGLPLRTLHLDDAAGVEFLYGLRTQTPPDVEITSVDPPDGPTTGGNEVILEGINFTFDTETQIRVDGVTVPAASWAIEDCGRLRISSMPSHGAGPVTLSVVNSLGAASLEEGYRYGGPGPRILAVEPAEGPVAGGIPLEIHGEHFTPDAVITLDGIPLEGQEFVDTTTISGTLPPAASAGEVDVRIEQGADVALLPGGFTYGSHVIRIVGALAAAGQKRAPVALQVTSPEALSAISFGFLYAKTFVTVADITAEGTPAEGAEFLSSNIDNENGVATFGLVMRLSEPTPTFPAGTDVPLGHILADVAAGVPPGTRIALDLEDQVGSPPIELSFTEAGETARIRPIAIDGEILVSDERTFVRGDANDDGVVNISDPIYHLNALFVGGAESPCQDAADANDDGQLNISDGIAILSFLFQGTNVLRPPHPDAGVDPTPDGIGCGT